jgi:hypothetical protein
VAQSVTVTARDRYGNTATDYRGTVHFTSSDPQAALPNDYAFTAADNGVHTFPAALKTAGIQSITATDTANSSFAGTQGGIVVNPAATSQLQVAGFPSPITAGSPGGLLVTALDPYGNVTPAYTGTVHLTSSDPQAQLEGDHTFTAADAGRYAFGATLKTAGTQSITATDTTTGTITGMQSGIVVNPAATSTFVVVPSPSTITAGDTLSVTVTAQDPYGNVTPGYSGTVHFTSSDPQAALPGDSTLTNGTGTFTAMLFTAGNQTITTTDTANPSITGTATVTVNPAVATSLGVFGYPSPTLRGVPHDFTVEALDPYGNIATGYTGTVTFSSDESHADLPADYAFTATDAGVHVFTATFNRFGTFYLAATDTSDPTITGRQSGIEVVNAAGGTPVGTAPGGGQRGASSSDGVLGIGSLDVLAMGSAARGSGSPAPASSVSVGTASPSGQVTSVTTATSPGPEVATGSSVSAADAQVVIAAAARQVMDSLFTDFQGMVLDQRQLV